MRGIGFAFSRRPTATAFLAGAALLAGGSIVSGARGGESASAVDDMALAIPRLSPFGSGEVVALPQPLAPSDAARMRRILALQARGAVAAAARETDQLDTSSPLGRAMLGVILADRYLGPGNRPDAGTLARWLARWPELPDAPAIYALMLARLPRGAPRPPPPAVPAALASVPPAAAPSQVPEETGPLERALGRNPDLDRSLDRAARHGGATAVRRLLARTSGLSGAYASQLLGEAGRILFTAGRDQEAYDMGAEGVHACRRWPAPDCVTASLPGFVAGLAAMRARRPERAMPMFEAAWRASLTTPALRAGAAFWVARARLALDDVNAALPWLRRAATEPDTFYGLLAGAVLRRHGSFAPGERRDPAEVLGEADLDAVAATRQGRLAFALLQVGEAERAEAALRQLWPRVSDTPSLARATMLVADRAGLWGLAGQLADLLQASDGRPRDETRFHVPRLRPDGGFRVDPAMIYALARTESNFDSGEVSGAGARGIMQLMPQTAADVIAGGGHRAPRRARVRAMLDDPGDNLSLGQDYVLALARNDAVAGDLIRLLASYNCGPARFAQWSGALRDEADPLLFIEAIPIDETRAFVPRVLTYTWLYARRLHLPTPSLDELAAGLWPRYHPLRVRGREVAARIH